MKASKTKTADRKTEEEKEAKEVVKRASKSSAKSSTRSSAKSEKKTDKGGITSSSNAKIGVKATSKPSGAKPGAKKVAKAGAKRGGKTKASSKSAASSKSSTPSKRTASTNPAAKLNQKGGGSLEDRILSLLKQAPGTVLPMKTLEGILGLHSSKGKVRCRKAVRSLRKSKKIIESASGGISLAGKAGSGRPYLHIEEFEMKSSKKKSRREKTKAGSKREATSTWGEKQNISKGKTGASRKELRRKEFGSGKTGDGAAFREAGSGLIGILDVTSRGDGYVAIEGREQDVMIPQSQMGTAMQGDTVKIRLTGIDRRRGREMGSISEIVERSNRLLVGRLLEPSPGSFVIEPDLRSGSIDFLVPAEELKDASPGDKVSFRLKEWAHPRGLPTARQVTVLGKAGTSQAEILGILAENQFQYDFPDDVEEFAQRIPEVIPDEVIRQRLDLRHMNIFTIDPADAKDFDDALSIEVLDNGNYYLGVHIADVTHYMPRGSALDQEASNRATSVYLVDRVIPMLPERLSNGVCSLRPNEDKCCYSCFMEISSDGRLVEYSIRETVIHSKQRFVYDEVQEILDGKDHELKPELTLLETLTKTLMADRFKAGAIAFETPEPRFVLDTDGTPLRVIIKERLYAHKLIEECMLMANKTVALHIEHLRRGIGSSLAAKAHSNGTSKGASTTRRGQADVTGGKDGKLSKSAYPFFYRVHDRPNAEKLENVLENVKPLGISFKVHASGMNSSQINDLLRQVEGTSLETIVNGLVLRSMAKAEYSPKNIGHFGLAFPHYAHFTSPIRRYPDVIVHRLLKSYFAGTMEYTFDELIKVGEHCSEQERNAVDAERDSVKLKQVEYLSKRLGQEFDAVISGVTEHGFYAQIKDIYCEGMVRMSELRDDYYTFHPERHALIGRGKNRQFRLGDNVRIRVLRTDSERRQIDLGLA